MTVLVDASVFVAILTREGDADELASMIDDHAERLCCGVGLWEASRAIARKRTVTAAAGLHAVRRLCFDFTIQTVSIGEVEAKLAIQAHDLYGKGSGHRAQLNMGDCFAYACAKANGARLLYKGDDFMHTDLV